MAKDLSRIIRSFFEEESREKRNVRYGPFSLRFEGAVCKKDGKVLDLTPAETLLFAKLFSARGYAVSKIDLWVAYQGDKKPFRKEAKSLDMHLLQLREKLGDEGRQIDNIYGVGYRLRP
jgi:two-component system alkaline phosphatase synthesis response regulator PhoP